MMAVDLKLEMAKYYKDSFEVYYTVRDVDHEFEVVKTLAVRVLQTCGLWRGTEPLADLALLLQSAQDLFENPEADVENITVATLNPAGLKKNLGRLRLDDGVKSIISTSCVYVERWMWTEEVELSDRLMALCYEASLVLEDILLLCTPTS